MAVLKKIQKKTVKVLKDPSAPKRPMSSYLLFSSEERPKVMAELGNIPIGEAGKELGRRWALLDKDSKGRYETAHVEEKNRYEQEKENYQPSKEFLEKKAELGRKENKVGGSENMAEYFSFLEDNWRKVGEETKGVEPKEVQEIIWQMWSKGKPKQKKVIKVRDPAEPKRPLSAFFIYPRQMREEMKKTGTMTMSNKEMLEVMSEKWKTMDNDMRKEYFKQAEDLKLRYKNAMMKFIMDKADDK